jgi:Flp pilus assembly protein TadG
MKLIHSALSSLKWWPARSSSWLRWGHPRRISGQALVETALVGIILAVLMAGALDLGRLFYTALVVENMAGEGARYGGMYPSRDTQNPCGCAIDANKNIQNRARQVAADRGIMIHQPDQADIAVSPPNCVDRRAQEELTVTVTYRVTDLFLPGLIGVNEIVIRKSAAQVIEENANCVGN